jgi:hypothetical protein
MRKKALKPARRRVPAGCIKERLQVATVRACRLAGFSRAGFYHKSRAKDQSALRLRIRRRTHMYLHRGPVPVPSAPYERWSMDFVHDQLLDGRPFRILTVIDQLSRDSPLIAVDFSMSGQRVAEALESRTADMLGLDRLPLITARGSPRSHWRNGLAAQRQARLHSTRETHGQWPH